MFWTGFGYINCLGYFLNFNYSCFVTRSWLWKRWPQWILWNSGQLVMNCCVSGIQHWVSNAPLHKENLSRVERSPPPPPPAPSQQNRLKREFIWEKCWPLCLSQQRSPMLWLLGTWRFNDATATRTSITSKGLISKTTTCTCITLFWTFICRFLPFSGFVENVNK